MIHIAICDDAPQELKNISLRIKKYIASNDLDAEVEEFSHPDALLLASEKTPFDLYLLDIIMPMITGIDVGRELRNRHSTAQLIYLTTSDEFAVDAFALRAVHYLTKPFTSAQFDEAIGRAMRNLTAAAPKRLTVRTERGELRTLDIGDISTSKAETMTSDFI